MASQTAACRLRTLRNFSVAPVTTSAPIDRSIQVMIAKLGLQGDLEAQEAETITYNDEVEDTRRYFQRVG